MRFDAGRARALVDHELHSAHGQTRALPVLEHRRLKVLRRRDGFPRAESIGDRLADRHNPIAAAFALAHEDKPRLGVIDIAPTQIEKFADPNSGAVKSFQRRAIAERGTALGTKLRRMMHLDQGAAFLDAKEPRGSESRAPVLCLS